MKTSTCLTAKAIFLLNLPSLITQPSKMRALRWNVLSRFCKKLHEILKTKTPDFGFRV